MVVTSGRPEALAMYQAILPFAAALGYGVLVAFSGSLENPPGSEILVTEGKINGFPEGQLPRKFAYVRADDVAGAGRSQEHEYRLLVVADKYQTGFDQPLLSAMYVDKKLTGVAAVQTLSRLNRILPPLKSQDDVRVLDFKNSAADIQASFAPWFETTIAELTDPNLLYDRERKVMDHQVLAVPEMEAFVRVLGEAPPGRLADAAERDVHTRLHRLLQPAIDRFQTELKSDDEREIFRTDLNNYTRVYAQISQIVDWGDPDLERLYQYGKVPLLRLPGRPPVSVDIGDSDLPHFRLEHTGTHNVSLAASGDGVVRGHSPDGGGGREPDVKRLADIIRELNERFGLDLGTGDEILVYQQVERLLSPRSRRCWLTCTGWTTVLADAAGQAPPPDDIGDPGDARGTHPEAPLTEAEAERLRADVQSLLDDDHPSEVIGLLEAALARAAPGSLPELRMRHTLAAALLTAGQYGRAAALFEQAGASYRRYLGAADPWTLDCAYQAGRAYAQAGKPEKALPQLRYFVANSPASAATDPDEMAKVLESRFVIAQLLATEGDNEAAIAELRAVRPLLVAAYGANSAQVSNLDKQARLLSGGVLNVGTPRNAPTRRPER